jgi:hypothetical protein
MHARRIFKGEMKKRSEVGLVRNGPMKGLLSRPVAFHPALARLCGSVTAGLMLSQAIYWTDVQERTKPELGGWFYKTQEEWSDEICLSRSEQETARKRLVALGFLKEEKRGMPGKMHFFVDVDRVCDALNQSTENQQTSLQETSTQVCGNPANRETRTSVCRNPADKSAGNQQTFLSGTETTQRAPESTSTQPDGRVVLKDWLAIQQELKAHMDEREWKLWARPARLLKLMAGGVLLIALPPNNPIILAARARQELLVQLALKRRYGDVRLTCYPDEYTVEQLREVYPEFYEQMYGNRTREARAQ